MIRMKNEANIHYLSNAIDRLSFTIAISMLLEENVGC